MMFKLLCSPLFWLGALLVAVLALSLSAGAEPAITPDSYVSGTAHAPAPEFSVMEWTAAPPALTEEQAEQLADGQEALHLPGPAFDGARVQPAGPPPNSESLLGEIDAPGDATLFRNVDFGAIVPAGYLSNVLEGSTAEGGQDGDLYRQLVRRSLRQRRRHLALWQRL